MFKTNNIHTSLRLNTRTGQVTQVQDNGSMWDFVDDIAPYGEDDYRFWLYRTQNMWTFIELDTYTGRLWQVQCSVKSTRNMFALPINLDILGYSGESIFDIQPLSSMYQFYLYNVESGEVWKFQWSLKKNNAYRWIKPTNKRITP